MPILINRETGLAENVPAEQLEQATRSTHDFPLVSAEGEHYTASSDDIHKMMEQGFRQPDAAELKNLTDYAKYSSTGEQIKTAAEGVAEGVLGPLAPIAERAMGVDPEAMRAREEINPVISGVAEGAGLVGSALTGVGAGAAFTKLGAKATEKAAAKLGTGIAARVAGAAISSAVENTAFQVSDEVSKLIKEDPNQSIESAAMSIGLSGLIGAGVGGGAKGTMELWKAGPGKQLESLMSIIKRKNAGGTPVDTLGLDIPPEIQAVIGSNPKAAQAFQVLMESNSKAGANLQETVKQFKKNISEASGTTLGFEAAELDALENLSKAKLGSDVSNKLVNTLKQTVEPIAEQYDRIRGQFKNAVVGQEERAEISSKLLNLIQESGLHQGINEDALKLVNKVISKIEAPASAAVSIIKGEGMDMLRQIKPVKQAPDITADELQKIAKQVYDVSPFGHPNYAVGKQIRGILDDALENSLTRNAEKVGLETLENLKNANANYKQFKEVIEQLNDRLHMGRIAETGIKGFVSSIEKMNPEDIASRLSLRKDFKLQQLLEATFPDVAAQVRKNELAEVVKRSLKDGIIDPNKLQNNISKLEPELRDYLINPQVKGELTALHDMLSSLPIKMNTSGTAKTLDALWRRMPESGTAVVAGLMGHNPIAGWLLGAAGKYLGSELPDSARLAVLRFLGSEKSFNSAGLKSFTNTVDAIYKSEAMLSKGTKAILGLGPLPVIKNISDGEREKLKKQVDEFAAKPDSWFDDVSPLQYYAEDLQGGAVQTAATAVQYLASLRPNTEPQGPLDSPLKASKTAEAAYNNALNIANNPAIVLKRLSDGLLTLQDIQHLSKLYPALYAKMQTKLMDQIVEAKHAKKNIPYKTKLGLSMFMGQPLDSSMQPMAIQANQPQQAVPQGQPPQPAHSTAKLSKAPLNSQTTSQAIDSRRARR